MPQYGASLVSLTIDRPSQFFVVNPAMKVTVDGVPQADLHNNGSVTITLPMGMHTVSLKLSFRETVFDVDLSESSAISATCNRITGKIDVRGIGRVPVYITKHR